MKKLLVFGIEDERRKKLEILMALQGSVMGEAELEWVKKEDYIQTVGDLYAGKRNLLLAGCREEEYPKESLLLMCGFEDEHIDILLKGLRQNGIKTDYKAIMTPNNQNWNILQLMQEMRAERAAIAGKAKRQER